MVQLTPLHFVAALGSNTSFTCSHLSSVMNVEWFLNGISFTSLQPNDIFQAFGSVGNVQIGSLQFINIPVEYNNTRIQCVVNTSSHETLLSQNSTLIVEGLLVQI